MRKSENKKDELQFEAQEQNISYIYVYVDLKYNKVDTYHIKKGKKESFELEIKNTEMRKKGKSLEKTRN